MDILVRRTPQEWRSLRNMSQYELAKAAGLTPTTISDYETGQYAPNAENWLRIARALSTEDEPLLMDQIDWPALMQEKPTPWRKSTASSSAAADHGDDPKARAA